jgi:DNA-binding CsgD family transcriptional regulator
VLCITPSERLALRLLAEGRPDGDVANALAVSPVSLDTHLSALFARMGVAGKREAVASASRRGLLVENEVAQAVAFDRLGLTRVERSHSRASSS